MRLVERHIPKAKKRRSIDRRGRSTPPAEQFSPPLPPHEPPAASCSPSPSSFSIHLLFFGSAVNRRERCVYLVDELFSSSRQLRAISCQQRASSPNTAFRGRVCTQCCSPLPLDGIGLTIGAES